MSVIPSSSMNGRLRRPAFAMSMALAFMALFLFCKDHNILLQFQDFEFDSIDYQLSGGMRSGGIRDNNNLYQRMLEEIQPSVTTAAKPKFPPFAFEQAETRDPLMLIGIFSSLSEESRQRRQLIRDTWANQKSTNPKICSLSTFLKQYSQGIDRGAGSCELVFAFVMAAGDDETSPSEISGSSDAKLTTLPPDWTSHKDPRNPYRMERDDMVYLNIQQSTPNECKAFTWLKFASRYLPNHQIDYVGRMDDTSIVDPNGFVGFIRHNLHPYPYNQKVYGGHYADLSTCTAPPEICKKALGVGDQSKFYMKDSFYFMSMDLAEIITDNDHHQQQQEGEQQQEQNATTTTNSFTPPSRTGYEDIDVGLHIQSATCCIKTISLPVWAHYDDLHHDKLFMTKWNEVAERQ